MGTKVYFLVEADECNAEPVSRMMSNLMGQMKKDSCCKVYPPPENSASIFSTIPLRSPESAGKSGCSRPSFCPPSKPKYQFKEITPGQCVTLPASGQICVEPIPCSPKANCQKSSIVAEATVDHLGQANTKIFVNSDTGKKDCPQPPQICTPPRNVYVCERRNGLEPEMRSAKKVYYVPVMDKIPQKKCPYRPSILSDGVSTSSLNSNFSGYYANQHLPMVAEMKKCARNLPEKRLIKYNACISRRDGMQDKCDPLSKKALKKCCRN